MVSSKTSGAMYLHRKEKHFHSERILWKAVNDHFPTQHFPAEKALLGTATEQNRAL